MAPRARVPADRGDTFWCEKLEKLLPGHACLRRQDERAKVRHPKTFELIDSPEPFHGYCATACEQGRDVRAALDGAPAAAPLPALAEARPAPAGARYAVRHNLLGSLGDPPPQARLWTDEVPDVPIAPVREQRAGLGPEVERQVAARVAEVIARRPPPPKEEPMPKGRRAEPCKNCGTGSTRCPDWCISRGGNGVRPEAAKPRPRVTLPPMPAPRSLEEFAEARTAVVPADAAPAPRLIPVPPPKPGAAVLGADGKVHELARALPNLEALDEDALLALREACDAELSRRLVAHETQVQRLRAALDRARGAAA